MLEKKRKYHFCDLFSNDTNEYYKIIGNYKFVNLTLINYSNHIIQQLNKKQLELLY